MIRLFSVLVLLLVVHPARLTAQTEVVLPDYLSFPSSENDQAKLPTTNDDAGISISLDAAGNFNVSTPNFDLVLNSSGQQISRIEKTFGTNDFGIAGVVAAATQQFEKPSVTDAGAPIPQSPATVLALEKARACLIVADEGVEEARLIDRVSDGFGEFGGFGYGVEDPEVVRFLIDRKGVNPRDVSQAYSQFVSNARAVTSRIHADADAKWAITIRTGGNYEDTFQPGPMETLGREYGDDIASGLYGASTGALGYFYRAKGLAAATGIGVADGLTGNQISQFGVEYYGTVGRLMDETGHDGVLPMLDRMSPRPDKSVLDSMRDAFGSVFSE